MVKDVRMNVQLIGRNTRQIDSVLGKPDFVERNRYMYTLVTDYGWGIDPQYLKYLVLIFDNDSVIVAHDIEEIDHDY